MPPTFALPPDTRAIGTANPPADMNAVVDVLNGRHHNMFYLDNYGADPTGASLSDTAFTSCYSDAAASVLTHAGAMITASAGTYAFSVNTFVISDCRIGFRGAGRYATALHTTGNTGTLLRFSAATGGANSAAPVSGFTAYGWGAGAAVNGVQYGGPAERVADRRHRSPGSAARAAGVSGSTTHGPVRGQLPGLQRRPEHPSTTTSTAPGASTTPTCSSTGRDDGGREQRGGPADGQRHALQRLRHPPGPGTPPRPTGLTTTVLQVGASTSDTCHIQGARPERHGRGGHQRRDVKDVLIQGATPTRGSSTATASCSSRTHPALRGGVRRRVRGVHHGGVHPAAAPGGRRSRHPDRYRHRRRVLHYSG